MRVIVSNETPTLMKVVTDAYKWTPEAGDEVVFSGDTNVTIIDSPTDYTSLQGVLVRDWEKNELSDVVYQTDQEWNIVFEWETPVIQSKTILEITIL